MNNLTDTYIPRPEKLWYVHTNMCVKKFPNGVTILLVFFQLLSNKKINTKIMKLTKSKDQLLFIKNLYVLLISIQLQQNQD